MSNRLEHEFPAVRWHAVPTRGLDQDLVRSYVERGHRLRSEAIRRIGRTAFAALGRAVLRIAAFVRCATIGSDRQASVGDCWTRSARRA